MARKGMMVGSGKRGYHNIIGKDPNVHSQSAKGIKQPQRLIEPLLIRNPNKKKNREALTIYDESVKQPEVTEIEYDKSIDEDQPETNWQKFKGRSEALALRGYRASKEALSKKLKEREEKEHEKNMEAVDLVKHPKVTAFNKQQEKIDALQSQINNLPPESDREDELFEKLEEEQAELDEMKEHIDNIKLEEFSDSELKELSVRHNANDDTGFFDTKNEYEEEYLRRMDRRKQVAEDIRERKKKPVEKGFFEEMF